MTAQSIAKAATKHTYLRALMRCFGKMGLRPATLPLQERDEMISSPLFDQLLKPSDLLFDIQGQLLSWHIDQVKDLLAQMPHWEMKRCWSFLPKSIAEHLQNDERFSPKPAWQEPFASNFFKRRFYQFLTRCAPFPKHLLAKTPFGYLLDYSADDLSRFSSFMAIHTLAVPMRHMIEREKRILLKKALSYGADKTFYLAYLRYLQSDINEQTAPISEIQFPLYKWDWRVESFDALVHRFGLYCLAKLLAGQEQGYLDHIALKLDPQLAVAFGLINQRGAEMRGDSAIAEQHLHRLAAKASDFLLSLQNPQREALASPTAPPPS